MRKVRGSLKRKDWRFIKRQGKDGKLSRKTKKRLQTSGRVAREAWNQWLSSSPVAECIHCWDTGVFNDEPCPCGQPMDIW